LRVGASHGARFVRGGRAVPSGVAGRVEHQYAPATRDRGRAEEPAQRAVRGVDADARSGRMRLDMCRGARAGGVEAGVRPRGRAGQYELQESGEEPEHSPGGRPQSFHPAAPAARRSAIAPTSTTPYMHTISGPVGRSPASESHSPRIEASAPEPQAM